MNKNTVPSFMGTGLKFIIAGVVAAFLAMHTVNFFQFIFPPEQVFYAYLGFGLTGGGLIAYLGILKWVSDTPLRKAIAITMIFVCAIGELAAAGFGMQVEGWRHIGKSFTAEELTMMIRVIQGLAFFHAMALILDLVGDEVMESFSGISFGRLLPKPGTRAQISSAPLLPRAEPASASTPLGFVPGSKIDEDGRKYEQVIEWREVAPVVAPEVVTASPAPFQQDASG